MSCSFELSSETRTLIVELLRITVRKTVDAGVEDLQEFHSICISVVEELLEIVE
jgi:hypothetical protein